MTAMQAIEMIQPIAARTRDGRRAGGTQTRDFLSVDDACDTIRRMAAALLAGEARPGIYNLASGIPLTVAAFVSQLAEISV